MGQLGFFDLSRRYEDMASTRSNNVKKDLGANFIYTVPAQMKNDEK